MRNAALVVISALVLGCMADSDPTDVRDPEPADSDGQAVHRSANSGTVAWRVALSQFPSFVRSDGSGNAYVAGTEEINNVPRIYVIKYNPFGTRLSKRTFPSNALGRLRGVRERHRMVPTAVVPNEQPADVRDRQSRV